MYGLTFARTVQEIQRGRGVTEQRDSSALQQTLRLIDRKPELRYIAKKTTRRSLYLDRMLRVGAIGSFGCW